MKKRIISLFLALTLCVGMLPAPAWAEEPTDPAQAVEAVGAANPSEETDPTTEPTEEETEPTEAETEPTEAPKAAEVPAEETAAPGEDEAVAAVQAMIDALPDVEDMSESYLDALVEAYSAYETLSESQQAQINGVEKLEALFNWVNSQVSTLAAEETISGEVNWNNRTFTKPVKLTGDTTLTLVGDNKIECDAPLDLNNCKLTVKGTGTLEVVGDGRSEKWMLNGAIFDSTYNGYNKGGTLTLAGGTVKASGGKYNAISVRSVELRGGKLEANGGSNAGIVCSDLYTYSGSLYATGSDCGIEMRTRNAGNPGNLAILASNEKNASMADMDAGDIGDIQDNAKKKTYYIGEVSGPMLSVKAQKGYLYEATAKTATFALSGRNVDLSALTFEWTGSHTGLTAEASADGKTLTVTTDKTVQAGTYGLKVSAGGASRTAVVTVSGPPICIYERPVDTISTDPEAGEVHVSAYLTKGHTGSIDFQWRQEDGTAIEGYTGENVPLIDLVEQGMLTQDASKPWLQTIRIYCTLSYDGYSLDTDTVTLGLSSCPHPAVDHEGNCLQCGQKKGGNGDALIVREDGLYHLISNEESGDANVGPFMYGGGNFYLTGDVQKTTVNVSDTDVGGEDVTLDLQGHTMKNLQMGNFPYGTFTVKNGTLGEIRTSANGKLILENIHYQGKWFDEEFELTVQGENTRFERQVTFWGTTHLRGGLLSQGLDSNCVDRALELLEDGFAFYDSADKVVDATDSTKLVGREIHVAAHPEHTLDSSGHCPCGYTAAATLATEAGKQYFADFGAALEAAKAASGSTLTLFQDVALTGENNLYIDSGTFTVDWHGHTLSGEMSSDLLLITDAAKVTLTDSVGTGGVHNTDGAAIGVYVRSQGSLTIRGGVYSPQLWKGERAYGSIQISGGRFENPTDGGRYGALYCDTGALADLLAPGYTFAYVDDDRRFNVYGVKMPDAYRSVYVVEHQQHEFDDEGQCLCGYVCPHAQVDDEGSCILCGKRFYVRGTYANGTTHYYGTISDALEDPAVTQATILRALTEECESWNGGDRSVTLDLNGWNLVVESIQGGHLILRDSSGNDTILGMKEILKDGQVTVESGRLAPQGELSVYGKLTVTGGKVDSLTAMKGSTVSLSGGSFGKIVGRGVTLKELLAENYYYAELDGETPKNYADTDTVIEQVSVVVCDHTSVRETKQGHFPVYTCNCGKVRYLLTVTDGSDSVTYHSDYSKGFAYAAKCSGVVRLLEKWPNDQTITMDVQGTVAIDMSGKSMIGTADLIIADGTTLKIVSDGAYGWDSDFPAESITVRSGGKFILPAKGPSGGDNKLKITGAVTVEAGAQAELSGGYCQVNLWGEARISGGKYGTIDVRGTENKLTVTGGEIGGLYLWGEIQKVQLSGGSVERLWVSEMDPDTSLNYRTITFEDIQSLLADGKAFRKADNTWLTEGDVEEFTPPMLGAGTVKKLSDVTIADVPMTGAAVYCQLGTDTYEEGVSTQYNVGETDSSGNVVFRLGVNIQSQEAQPGVTVQWYELGAEDSRTPVGTGQTCPLDLRLPVGTHRFLAVVNCSGYVLESQPFAVTVTPRVVNITGGFTAQDRDYEPDNPSVQIIQGEVTFDKKAEEDDLSAQVHGGTIATPDAGQNRTVDYSVTLTGEDKDNYILGSKPDLTVTIRPIAQTLTFAETAVTKTYGDSPFVNALDHSAGDGPITYTSSDPAVATAGTDGTVTIRGAGEARITATAAATQNYVETAASFDLTVAKATGTVRNRNYSLGYLYGDDIPTPERKYFEASSTGAFRYSWSPAAPKNAGNYQLTVTVDEDGNYTSATLVLDVLVEKDVWVRPTLVKAENETVDGKKDGKVTYTDTPALEYRIKRDRGEWIPVAVPAGAESVTVEGLAPGTYEFRRPGDENHFASSPETITIQPGRKLKVTLPENQTGYTLTASKTQLGWHEDVELSFQLDSVGVYKAADFGIWAEAGSEKTKLTLGNDGAVKLTAPEKDITITVTGVKTDDVAPRVYIQGRMSQDSFDYVKWEGFQENPADDFVNGNFVISATDRLSGVASLWYCLSQTPLTLADMDTASWKQEGKVSITEDGVYYLYAKALDNANNAGYACTGKLVKESNPPTFSGVKDGETYYVTQQMEIHDDGMPDWYMAKGSIGVVPNGGNENPIKLRLPNNGSSYTFTVGDRCGNEASITVYMKPLSDLTQPLDSILEDTIRKSDRATLDDVEATLKGLDVTYATEPEKKEMNDALARIAQLRQVLDQVAAVEAQIAALPDSVEPYQQTVEDTQIKPARQAYSDLTDHQKTLVDSTKLDKLARLEAQLNAWTITEGDGQTWYKGSWNPLSFTVNGQTRKFSKVLLDGRMSFTATPSFLAVSGSIDEPFTLTLKPELLQVSMKPGEHTLTVIYGENNSGTGTVTFTVEIPANYLDVTGKPEFDGKTTVTVDGKEYPIEEMNGTRYVNLPETGDLLTIYSFKDGTPAGSHTNYPTGMQVFRITRQEGGAKAEEITEFANLLNYAGCSIRISGKQGIRMITGITQDNKKALTSKAGLSGYTLEEYGTVVQWADTLGSNTLNLDNSNKQNYAYKKGKADPIFAKADGMIQYTNVLVGFTDAQCQPDLVMRPYIKLKDMTTGETVTLYGGCVTRSIGYVALQNRDTYKPGTASYKYVHKIIEAVYGQEP